MSQFSGKYGEFHFTVHYTDVGGELRWTAEVIKDGRLVTTKTGMLHSRPGRAPYGDSDVAAAVEYAIDTWQEYRQAGEVTPYTDFDE